MDSPSSTKSRSSRNNSYIELLKPHVDKMSINCKKYRDENKLLRDEVRRLKNEKRQLEHRIEQDDLKHSSEIINLNKIVEDLQCQCKILSKETNQYSHQINYDNYDHNYDKEQQNPKHQLNKLNNQYNHHHSPHNPLNSNNQQNILQNYRLNSLPNNLNHNLLTDKNALNGNVINDSLKLLVGRTMDDWIQDSNKQFKSVVNEKIQTAKRQFLISLGEEVDLIIKQLTIENNFKSARKSLNLVNEQNQDHKFQVFINPDIKLALKPLKGMIESINQHFNNKKLEISKKIDELEDTQRNLESSLNQTRIADYKSKEFELIQKIIELENDNESLIKLKDELLEKNRKMEEDNRQLCSIEEDLKGEIDQLKDELSECKVDFNQLKQENKQLKNEKLDLNIRIKRLETQNELNFEIKEQTILGKIKKDNENLAKELNGKFSELLDELKDTLELLQPTHKKKMYDQIKRFLNKFERFANDKIKENTALFDNYTNISMSFMDVPANV